MDWLRMQLDRPIERQEWVQGDGCVQRWILVDDGRVLALREDGGVAWAGGSLGRSKPTQAA
jgi:hypothetical protein